MTTGLGRGELLATDTAIRSFATAGTRTTVRGQDAGSFNPMNTNLSLAHNPRHQSAPRAPWERTAPWVAPLLTAGVLAAATYLVFASCGAALI
jgi:hypothetical protein